MKQPLDWLNGEIDAWVRGGVVDRAAAARIRTFYGGGLPPAGRSRLAIVFSVLGALLLAGGLILLIAHNWDQFPRSVRVVCALVPLVAAQVLAWWWVIGRAEERVAVAESLGGGWAIACGGAIAIVSQVYHLGGDLETFLMVWSFTVLPIVWLLRSVFAAMVYLGVLCGWTGMGMEAGRGGLIWVGLLPLAPLARIWWTTASHSSRSVWALWALVLAAAFGCGSSLERSIPGLWTLVFSGFFGALVAFDSLRPAGVRSWMRRPAALVGAVGIFVLALMFTYEWPWERIGWHAYRADRAQGFLLIDVALAIVPGTLSILQSFRSWRAGQRITPLFLLFPACAFAAYAMNSMESGSLVGAVIFNVWMLGTGVLTAVSGARSGRLALMNGGLFAAASVIVARFFDADMSLLVRGLVFVVLGAGLLASNLYVMRRKGGAA